MCRRRIFNKLFQKKIASRAALLGLAATSLFASHAGLANATSRVLPVEESATTSRSPRLESLTTYLGQSIYGAAIIPVRAELGLNSLYQDRSLELVYIEYYPETDSQLLLLLDGRPAGRPQTVDARAGGYVFFNLPDRRNFIGRNFNTVELQIQGYGYCGELGAELGQYYAGDRPLPPYPPFPPYPYPPFPPFPPIPPGPIHPIP